MANSKKRSAPQRKPAEKKPAPNINEPWLNARTGLTIIILFGLGFAAFVTWQLAPSQGLGSALLWGLGFGAAFWVVFGLALAFNTWVRRRR